MTNQNIATGSDLYSTYGNTAVGAPNAVTGGDFTDLNTLQSFWFVKSDHLGKVSVGLQSQASDNTAISRGSG